MPGRPSPSRGATPPQPAAVTASRDAAMVEQAIAAASNGASKVSLAIATGLANTEGAPTVTPLPARRAAEEYEALRDASAAFAANTGAAPAILQLNIGPSGRYRLRADWTASFFEAAGFAVDGARDFATIRRTPSPPSTHSTATIAVITSDDATYQETVAPLAAAVKAAKPGVTLLVAGAPGDHEAAWRAAGVDDFVNVRSNNYELNRTASRKGGSALIQRHKTSRHKTQDRKSHTIPSLRRAIQIFSSLTHPATPSPHRPRHALLLHLAS